MFSLLNKEMYIANSFFRNSIHRDTLSVIRIYLLKMYSLDQSEQTGVNVA